MADRIRTNAEIDMLNSYLKEGDTALPYEATVDSVNPNPEEEEKQELTEAEELIIAQREKEVLADQKENEKIEDAKQKELQSTGEEKKADLIKEEIAPIVTEIKQETQIDDAAVLAYLKSKSGKEITSLDEFLNPKKELTEDEIKVAAEKREAKKMAYGLENDIFTKKELEGFISDTKNKQDFVLAAYTADQKSMDDTLTDAEIEEEFFEKFSLEAKEESREYKVGQDLLDNLYSNLLKKKYPKILGLENDFSAFEKKQEKQEKILSDTPKYKQDIEQIRNDIKKVSLNMGTETFETELPSDAVEKVISKLLNPEYATNQISAGWNMETIKQVATTSAIIENLPYIMEKYADAQVLRKQAGIRGVQPDKQRGQRIQEGELTERQKVAITMQRNAMGMSEQQIAN